MNENSENYLNEDYINQILAHKSEHFTPWDLRELEECARRINVVRDSKRVKFITALLIDNALKQKTIDLLKGQ